jgi:hypothetical protein
MYWQYPKAIGPAFVFSQGNSWHSKQRRTPFSNAQVEILQNLFSLGTQPSGKFGHVFATRRWHFSQAMPQTPIFIFIVPWSTPLRGRQDTVLAGREK